MYNQTHYCIGYLIKSFVGIPFVDSLFARLSSDYILDLLLLGFIIKFTTY